MKRVGISLIMATLFIAGAAVAQTSDPAPPGWITATNKPCKIWNPQPQPNESVTWSGQCKDGFASGMGVLEWTENGHPDVKFEGEYANGKRNGRGVITTPDGNRTVGMWVDDQPYTDNGNAI